MLTLARTLNPLARMLKPNANPAGSRMWTEVAALGELVRSGQATWEDLDLDDIDTRLKWAGLFHRRKRVPGTFMMRLKVRRRQQDLSCAVPRGHSTVGRVCVGYCCHRKRTARAPHGSAYLQSHDDDRLARFVFLTSFYWLPSWGNLGAWAQATLRPMRCVWALDISCSF